MNKQEMKLIVETPLKERLKQKLYENNMQSIYVQNKFFRAAIDNILDDDSVENLIEVIKRMAESNERLENKLKEIKNIFN